MGYVGVAFTRDGSPLVIVSQWAVGSPSSRPPCPIPLAVGQGSGLAAPVVTQPGHSALPPGPPSSSAPRRPPSPRPIRASSRTRGGDISLAYGSLAPDSSSEDLRSGDEDSSDESVPVNELYSSTAQRLSRELDVLLEVAPSLFSGAEDPSHTSEVSAIEEVLGCSSGTHALPELRESRVVASAVQAAFKSASSAGRVAPSHFLPCVKPWFQHSRYLRFRREVLPEASLVASQAVKELMSAKEGSPVVTLPDKVLASWETQLLFSLKNLSLADFN